MFPFTRPSSVLIFTWAYLSLVEKQFIHFFAILNPSEPFKLLEKVLNGRYLTDAGMRGKLFEYYTIAKFTEWWDLADFSMSFFRVNNEEQFGSVSKVIIQG